jgi:hypothetical protein
MWKAAGLVPDLSAYGNDATATAALNRVTSLGASINFAGVVGDALPCGTSDTLNIVSALTLAVWVRTENLTASKYLLQRDHYGLYLDSSEIPQFQTRKADDSGWDTNAVGPALALGQWAFVVAVFDPIAQTKTVYVDGVAGTPVAKTDGGVPTSSGATTYVGGNASATFEGDLIAPQIFAEAKDATWVAEQYQLGLNALWQTDFAAQESIANETTGYLSNTPFSIQSGTWKISEDVIDDQPVKVIECVAAGVLSVPISALNQTPGEGAYGTWDFWINKADPSDALISIVSQNLVSASLGYYVRVDTSEAVSLVEAGVGDLITGGSVTAATWHSITVTRTSSGVFSLYVDDTLVGSATDVTLLTSSYVLLDLDAGDKFAFADKNGNHSLIKRLIPEEV